jgi:hypothetical protein
MFVVVGLLLSACATRSRLPLYSPVVVPPPAHNTNSLGGNIDDIDNSLKKASSEIDRIKILIDSIPVN